MISDAYIRFKATVIVPNTEAATAPVNNTNEKVIFKNFGQFTKDISEMNNTQLDYTQDLDIVMPMFNLIEYIDTYSKTSGSLW